MKASIALVHNDADGHYGVSFPDLPGCITAGTTLDEAGIMAEDALALHLEGLDEDGTPRPDSSSFHDVMANRENRNAVAVAVPVEGEGAGTVRTNITLSSDMLDQIDRFAEHKGMTRSGFLTNAAKRAIEAA